MDERILICEDYKKKGKVLRGATIALFVFSIIYPLLLYFGTDNYDISYVVFFFFYCLVASLFMLLLCLIAFKYKLIVTEKAIIIHTLFGKLSISFDDIVNYTYKKALAKNEYSFCFVIKNKRRITVGVYHIEQMLNLLKQKGISPATPQK